MKKITALLLAALLFFISSGCATVKNINTGEIDVVVKSDAITPVEITSALAGLAVGFVGTYNNRDFGNKALVALGSGLYFYGFGSIILADSYKTDYRKNFIICGIASGFVLGGVFGIYEGIQISKLGPMGPIIGFFLGCIIAGLALPCGAGLGNIAGHIADIFTGKTGNEGRTN
jgi:hypothetical protein